MANPVFYEYVFDVFEVFYIVRDNYHIVVNCSATNQQIEIVVLWCPCKLSLFQEFVNEIIIITCHAIDVT